jgi:DNA ligase-1
MLLEDIVATSAAVRSTRSRLRKIEHLATLLRHLEPDEVAIAAAYLAGEPRQQKLGVGYASVHGVDVAPAATASLTLAAVDATLDRIAAESGPGSARRRQAELDALFAAATKAEQEYLRGMILRNLRQGASEGIMIEALASAIGAPAPDVRRAVMMAGSLIDVAAASLRDGPGALATFRLRLFTPILPMLAQSAPDVAAAVDKTGPASVEAKLDGARIQVHRAGDRIGVYTRNLRNVTESLPEVAAAVRSLPATAFILDGESLALRSDGTPLPFQDSMSEFGTESATSSEVRLRPFFFDILHLDGEDLVDQPAHVRWAKLESAVPLDMRVDRVVAEDSAAAEAMFRRTLEAGHEGVVVKALASSYEAGRRGAAWIKVKPAHTLDLVVIAIEWGSGRRRGWLSNLHLGARDPSTGGFVMLGKTFKGMTDSVLQWQTERFLELETHREGHVVYVRPEQVVEIAFDGVQRSSRYPGGVALRFARVKAYREDKSPAEADTIDTVRAILEEGHG